MKDLNQLLLKFDLRQNYKNEDFYVNKSNFFAFDLINKWPKWEKNILNIHGEKYCGKTHLSNIFKKKYNAFKVQANEFNNENLKEFKIFENLILDDFDENVDEKLMYTLFNIADQDNKYILINSLAPINQLNFKLADFISRTKNCLFAKIEKPDDELIFAILLKIFQIGKLQLKKNSLISLLNILIDLMEKYMNSYIKLTKSV